MLKRLNERIRLSSCATAMTPATPDPWLVRKFVVFVVLGLSVWACYVGIGRVCVPSIHEDEGAGFTRRAGIGLLVVFLVLWLMFIWSYFAILFEPAGFARDHVPRAPKPPTPPGMGYSGPAMGYSPSPPLPFLTSQPSSASNSTPPAPQPPATYTHYAAPPFPQPPFQQLPNPELVALEDIPPTPPQEPVPLAPSIAESDAPPSHERLVAQPAQPGQSLTTSSCGRPKTVPYVIRPNPPVSTMPRWCQYCEIIKPDRTHHCRHCGTCVLQFDHHCVWIGRCVGWQNHAIFISFNFWAGLFCTYNTVLLIVFQAMSSPVDPQKIVLMPISGFLGLFTLFMLLPTHITLVLQGRTTLEGFQTRSQQTAEEAAIKNAFNSNCPVYGIRAVRKRWEEEYGGVKVNDRWAFGRKRDLWRQEMGSNWLRWILPIGKPLGDGIHFMPNPRFGPHGEWLRMEDWPKVVAVK